MNREIAAYIDRLVALEKQKAEIVADEADIKAEIKSAGYDAALIMKCVRLKMKDEQKRRKELDQIELFDTYLAAAGLIADRGGGSDAEPEPEPTAAQLRAAAQRKDADKYREMAKGLPPEFAEVVMNGADDMERLAEWTERRDPDRPKIAVSA